MVSGLTVWAEVEGLTGSWVWSARCYILFPTTPPNGWGGSGGGKGEERGRGLEL